MKKINEEKYYHATNGKCSGCSDEPITESGKHDEINLSWDEIQAYINPPLTDEQLAEQAQSEMITELNWCDLQLKYHATGDTKRAVSTVELINAYAVECRDYVQNVDGVLTIVGDKPERPE